jgi:hypothetical protein
MAVAASSPASSVDLSLDDDLGPGREEPSWRTEVKESSQSFELDLQVGMDTPLAAAPSSPVVAAPPPAVAPQAEAPRVHATAPAPSAEAPLARAAADGGEAALKLALSQASREVIERVVWEVVPQLAEVIVREHVERLARERSK